MNLAFLKEFSKSLIFGPFSPPKVTSANVVRFRIIRLMIVAIFVVSYLVILSLHSTKSTASIIDDIRDILYEDGHVDVESLLEQKWSKRIDHFMNGPTISEFLNGMQQLCKTESLLEGGLKDSYDCNIIQIDYSGLHNTLSHPMLPCEDITFIDAVVEIGDGAEYGTIPFVLQEIYDKAGTPDDQRIEEQGYDVHAGWGLFNPLFNTDEDKSQKRMGPLPLINQKLNLLGKAAKAAHEVAAKYIPTTHIMQNIQKGNPPDTTTRAVKKKLREMQEEDAANRIAWDVFNDDSWDFDISSGPPRAPDMTSDRLIERNHHWDLLMRCDPKKVEVTFMLSRNSTSAKNAEETAENLWWRVGVEWRRVGFDSKQYRSYVSIQTGSVYQELNSGATIFSLFVLFMFFLHILPHVLCVD
eukprot:Lankesteria_metandrocarpae@DN133_c0_g1_i1.p1